MSKPVITLRQVLQLLDSCQPLPDEWTSGDYSDIRPRSSYKVCLCFMCEEETWVRTYPGHPILIPWYGCLVTSISPQEDDTLEIWLDYGKHITNMKERRL